MKKQIERIISIFIVLMLINSTLVGCGRGKVAEVNKELSSDTIAVDSISLKEENIQQENIMNTIEELVSEKYMGRLAGTIENQLAAQYIADYFKEIGLESPKGLENYMQYYQQLIVELTEEPVMQILDKNGKAVADFSYTEDFVLRRLYSDSDMVDIEAPLYLVEDPNVLNKYDSKLNGKILLIPCELNYMLGYHNTPVDYAETCGALGAIGEFDLENNILGYTELKVTTLIGSWLQEESYKPFAYVNTDAFEKLTKAAKTDNKLHFSSSSRIKISSDTANVIGLIPGSDPVLKDNYIIIGAHFDHVGNNMNGTYNPGALDNASGTAAMIELARVIKESKTAPKLSILFIAFNGEEGGLRGSYDYCQNPLYPLDKAVMINLDMVGSTAKIPLTIAIASDKSDVSLRDDLAAYADELAITYEKGIELGSDHTYFSFSGIPSALLSNSDFKSGYHNPHDTIKSVDGYRVKEIVKLVMHYIKGKAF